MDSFSCWSPEPGISHHIISEQYCTSASIVSVFGEKEGEKGDGGAFFRLRGEDQISDDQNERVPALRSS
ncbi:hypothetical protein RRG08_049877 [Elysia crispata]|uniref:Uncharacterized protein n=1 Tax=Elysia crispata TaxID=231223 RepID=A0AAE0XZ62_9GAST|nr:hypothetical protein RRG08_049877 [Elysia crispata]